MNCPSWVRRPLDATSVAGVVTLALTALGGRPGGAKSPYGCWFGLRIVLAGASSGDGLAAADDVDETTLADLSLAYGEEARRLCEIDVCRG
jgi:hypothetical protein